MSEMNPTARRGMRFCEMLCLLFITLKLTGHIDWSWWLVLAPMWVGPAAVVGFVLALVTLAGIGSLAQQAIKWLETYGKPKETNIVVNRVKTGRVRWPSADGKWHEM